MRFENKVALVIGGNSGIGLAVAEDFGEWGRNGVHHRPRSKTLADAEAKIPGAKALRADIADVDSLRASRGSDPRGARQA